MAGHGHWIAGELCLLDEWDYLNGGSYGHWGRVSHFRCDVPQFLLANNILGYRGRAVSASSVSCDGGFWRSTRPSHHLFLLYLFFDSCRAGTKLCHPNCGSILQRRMCSADKRRRCRYYIECLSRRSSPECPNLSVRDHLSGGDKPGPGRWLCHPVIPVMALDWLHRIDLDRCPISDPDLRSAREPRAGDPAR